jgi:hypothetical protein
MISNMAPKPKSASNNSSTTNNKKMIKAAEVNTAWNKMMGVDTKDKVRQFAQTAVLGVGLARAAGLAAEATIAGRARSAGSRASQQALAKSAPSTSKTMQVPKGSKVITSDKSGSARATSGVDRVTIQKSQARVSAGIQSNAASEGRIASANSRAKDLALIKNAVIVGKVASGSYDMGSNRSKPKPKKK